MKTEPTQEQLALIAATLSRSLNDPANHLVSKALAIWQESGRALRALNPTFTEQCLEANKNLSWRKPTDPGEYPIARDNIMKILLPEKDAADRAPALKKYLAQECRLKNNRDATTDEINQTYAKFGPLPSYDALCAFSRQFHTLYKEKHRSEVNTANGSKGGRPKTKKEKKPLTQG